MATPTVTLDALPLLRLLQLASPSLPVGAYAYSQGLEWAVEAGWVHDTGSLGMWLSEQLDPGLAHLDLPILARLQGTMARGDSEARGMWIEQLLARRETHELRADDCARGRALAVLLVDLGVATDVPWSTLAEVPLAAPFAAAAHAWAIPSATALLAYAWGWLENQILCGIKLIPLGQVAGQRMLLAMAPRVIAACQAALACEDDDIGATLPAPALASTLPETQYARLFRS